MTDSEQRTCQSCHTQFEIESADFAFYEKIDVPSPTWCPNCRVRWRMLFRNFKTLYTRPSDRSQQPMVSMYPAAAPFPVFTNEEWWQDNWDPRSFARNVDFTRPFFEQFHELLLVVPRFGLMNVQSENCAYTNFTTGSRNSYFVFGCVDTEDSAYGHIVWESKDSFDNLYLYRSELCYECVDCLGSYQLLFCQESDHCRESIGLYGCQSCSNCIGCVGLTQKQYYLFNEPVGKEGYEQFLAEHPLSDPATITHILGKQAELCRSLPQRFMVTSQSTDVSGNHIYNASNVQHSFDVKGGENAKYLYTVRQAVDSYDVNFSPDIELAYEALTCRGRGISFAQLCFQCTDIYYSDNCFNAKNLFGCVGMKGGQYFILNKQYSQEEYEALVPRLIAHMRETGEWGQFFPPEHSPFAYNEAIVGEYYPLARKQALDQGFRWADDPPITTGQETMTLDRLPTQPEKYTEDLLKEVLKCQQCGKNYRLIAQELAFYTRLHLPIPRRCFHCRHARRMTLRNVRSLFPGQCARCRAAFQTSYTSDQQQEFRIYCEACYQKEVVG